MDHLDRLHKLLFGKASWAGNEVHKDSLILDHAATEIEQLRARLEKLVEENAELRVRLEKYREFRRAFEFVWEWDGLARL